MTQGDPSENRGISAITRGVAAALKLPRAMVFLDPAIADYHKPNADHHGVILEIPYSVLTSLLEGEQPGSIVALERAIDAALDAKNEQREREGKGPMQSATIVISRDCRKSPKRPATASAGRLPWRIPAPRSARTR